MASGKRATLERVDQKLDDLKEQVAVLSAQVNRRFEGVDGDLEKAERRLRSLENWRAVLVGGGIVTGALIGYMGWDKFFGG